MQPKRSFDKEKMSHINRHKYYSISKLIELTGIEKRKWYKYISNRYTMTPPLLVKKEAGRVSIKGDDVIRILNRENYNQDKIKIPINRYKYYSISELIELTGINVNKWYQYISNRYTMIPPLLVKKEAGRVSIKGDDVIRVLNRERIYNQDKIKIPDFAKGTVVEMCMKVAGLAETEESKQIWAATAIYAYYAIKNEANKRI